MNKAELLSAISGATGLKKDDVNNVLNKYNEIVINQLLKDKEFTVLELGKLKIARRAERKAFNPTTREPITIPAADVPRFSFSRKLKQTVADGGK